MPITRADLRREIAHRTQQPFFREFGGDYGSATSGSTTTLVDTTLLHQPDDAWNGDVLYIVTNDQQRIIDDFDQSDNKIYWLAPATAVVATNKYEIWSQFTPREVHKAINAALAEAWPFFFGSGAEDIVIVGGRGTRYTLPTSTNVIRSLLRVYLKQVNSVAGRLTEDMPDTVTLRDANASFTAADVGKKVTIYNGSTAALGQLRTVASVDSATQLTVSVAFSATADEGDAYRLLDDTDVNVNYEFLQNWRVDKYDTPTELWLADHPLGYEGHRLHIVYEYEHPALASETAATTCPQEYVLLSALAKLYQMQISNAPATEVANWEAQSRSMAQAAAQYAQTHQQGHGSGTLVEFNSGYGFPTEYPFR